MPYTTVREARFHTVVPAPDHPGEPVVMPHGPSTGSAASWYPAWDLRNGPATRRITAPVENTTVPAGLRAEPPVTGPLTVLPGAALTESAHG
ncbi:hypothetical protein [Actinomadura xylanilytica]|uniref:hypothetical protein n=1 Tax=Actinomadura xylanilytica TaxID=887459 RepID=UPI00255A9812|nr:hypothetical protein [Actinomadura xylanilytica]MDL4774233.1 hypothetical protein [Actinomadura xylanilytica]